MKLLAISLQDDFTLNLIFYLISWIKFKMTFDLSKLESKFEIFSFNKGHVLFKQGDKNSDGFILKSGVVGLTREVEGTIVHAAKINAGEVMGVWKCLFDLPERTFTATCLLDVTVLRIPEENLKKIINGADPFLKYCIGSWLSITRQFMGQKS